MTIARAHLVDPSVTGWYRCVTRCVRRAFLLGEGMHDRKSWIEHRLEELAEIFSVAVAGFAILDNHLHLLVRLDPDVARGWSDEDVVRRWGRLFLPRDKVRQVAPVSDEWVQARLKNARWVATARERLQSLSWFMKCLKEPLSRLANREEQTRGAFFEGRFKSVAILDEESLLATCAYIEGFSLGNYVLLVEYTGRLFREGKAVISGELAGVFERLGSNAEELAGAVAEAGRGPVAGPFLRRRRARLREVAERLGVHHLANLGGCAARSRRPEGWIPSSSPFHLGFTPARMNRRHASSTCRGRGRGLPMSASLASSICFDPSGLPPAREECPAGTRSARRRSAKTAMPLDGWGLMNVTYFGSGSATTRRSSGIGSG